MDSKVFIIKKAFEKCPASWKEMEFGATYAIPVIPELNGNLETTEELDNNICFNIVKFKFEKGCHGHTPAWRILGKFENTEIIVAEGPLSR